jgi:hypothetical protein
MDGSATTTGFSEPRAENLGSAALAILAVFAVLATCSCTGKCIRPAGSLTGCLSEAYSTSGLATPESKTYSPSNIFDYIDGEGDLFLKYHFVELQTFESADKLDRRTTVEIYRMGSSLDALGIFSVRNFDGVKLNSPGNESSRDGACLEFYRGRYFVKVCGEGEFDPTDLALAVDRCLLKYGAP